MTRRTLRSAERRLDDMVDDTVDGYPTVSLAVVAGSNWTCVDTERHLYVAGESEQIHHCPALAELNERDDSAETLVVEDGDLGATSE